MSLISSLSNPGIPRFSSIIIAIVCSYLKMSPLLYTWLLYTLITSDSLVLVVDKLDVPVNVKPQADYPWSSILW